MHVSGNREYVTDSLESVFHNYCPLKWMFCNRDANKRIDRTHKRALQMLYKDFESSFEALPTRYGNNSIHVNNLKKLIIEILKSMNGLNPHLYGSFMKGNILLII